tara:strand:- start:2873 stop:3985 length:1113 start_codon:yes stop_codon:yes gene_type:complete
MKIPFVDLKREANLLSNELLDTTKDVLLSGQYINGDKVKLFEGEFAKYCNVDHAISVGNGSDALTLIMRALEIGPGDEVICPGNSFIATAWSIVAVGAKPIFCDVEEDFLVSVRHIQKLITSSTKALIAVHLTGKLCKMDELNEFCSKNKIYLIEDAAQSIGSTNHKSEKSGSFGIAAAFSLHPLKNLAVYGDGGVITSNNNSLAKRVELLRNHGLINRDECKIWGYNSRLDEIQAAYGLVKFKYIEKWTDRYIYIAKKYSKNLTEKIIKPKTDKGFRDVFHNYIIIINPDYRDLLMRKLNESGVQTKIHYPIPLHLQQCSIDSGYSSIRLPMVEKLAKSMISLPIYPLLEEKEIDYVISTFNNMVDNMF